MGNYSWGQPCKKTNLYKANKEANLDHGIYLAKVVNNKDQFFTGSIDVEISALHRTTGKKVKSSKQAQSDLKKSVDKFNSGIDKMTSAINKVRKADGKSPKKPPKKLTLKTVLKQVEKGVYK